MGEHYEYIGKYRKIISLCEFSYTTCFAPTTPTVVTLIPFHGNHWFWGGGCVTDPWRQVQVGRAVALQRLNVLVHPLGGTDDTCCLVSCPTRLSSIFHLYHL